MDIKVRKEIVGIYKSMAKNKKTTASALISSVLTNWATNYTLAENWNKPKQCISCGFERGHADTCQFYSKWTREKEQKKSFFLDKSTFED